MSKFTVPDSDKRVDDRPLLTAVKEGGLRRHHTGPRARIANALKNVPRKIKNVSRGGSRSVRATILSAHGEVRRFSKAAKKSAVQKTLRLFSRSLPNPKRVPRSGDIHQVVLLGDMGIGNFIMLTPLLRALRNGFPNAEIVVLFIKGRGADLVAARLDSIDRIVHLPELHHGRLRDSIRFLRAAKGHQFAPQLLVGRFNGNPIIPLMGIAFRPKWRVGHVSSAGFSAFCDEVFNFPVVMQSDQHEVERNLALARAIGLSVDNCVLEFPVHAGDLAEAEQVCMQLGVPLERLICLQIGSSKLQQWKRWPSRSWSELIDLLVADGWVLALIGSEQEAAMADEAVKAYSAQTHNLCGLLSLGATAALLRSARLLVCNDSGLMHVAAAVGTPIVALFGPTEYERTRPWCDHFVAVRNPCSCNQGSLFDRSTVERIEACARPCINGISAAQVMDKVRELLGKMR